LKARAPRNQTLSVSEAEAPLLQARTHHVGAPLEAAEFENRIFCQDLLSTLAFLPPACVDLLIADPPYNLAKQYGSQRFQKLSDQAYEDWLNSWLPQLRPCLKPTASLYVCCDWRSSRAIQNVLEAHYQIRNRITWEREKGRGARNNWKNCSEDIWFCTVSDRYTFNLEAVKQRRRVRAPYRQGGQPRDWQEQDNGKYRLTCPSNLWTDLTVPFWSMPENTDHPAQKPEKLMAKLILASSQPGDLVFDPFAGSGTACVVAHKLQRRFVGVEREPAYCQLALKRLDRATQDTTIQGYQAGVFWERNSLAEQPRVENALKPPGQAT
jgi:site-specific DNA-methyltransferase (adenine-specific)